MHVAFVTLVDPTGTSGQNLYSRAVASALANRDDTELSLLCPEPQSSLPTSLSDEITSVYYLPKKQPQSIKWHIGIQKPMYDCLIEIHQEHEIKGIVTPLKPSIIIPPFFSYWFDIPQVLLVEGMMTKNIKKIAPFPGAGKLTDFVANVNAHQSDCVFTAYDEAKEWISSPPHVETSKVEVFHHGVNTHLFSPVNMYSARNELDLCYDNNEFIIGFVGSFKEYHCLNILIEATANLIEKGRNVGLLLIGEGPERESMEARCQELGIEDSVTFTGFVEHKDVSTYICACNALYGVVDPEHWGSPMKVYEYLACGRPAIVYDSDELSFVEELKLGVSVTSVSTPAVTEAIEDIYKITNQDRVNMGISAREYILDNQTWDAFAKQITTALSK